MSEATDDHPFSYLTDKEVEDSVRAARAVRIVNDFTNLTAEDLRLAMFEHQVSRATLRAMFEAAVSVATGLLERLQPPD